jgi:hypothetical protein
LLGYTSERGCRWSISKVRSTFTTRRMVFEVSHNWSWRTERLFVFTGHNPFANG